ncbi:MAG: RES family NAD+ phosphorylase [bacterium]|nr:RES family NAD+ phosphorylase [bacterium]
MEVFRLSREKYKDSLSGRGAALRGQRWNSAGVEIIYTSSSRALAMAEVGGHLPVGILPKDYHMVEILIPDRVDIYNLPEKDLPDGWDTIPKNGSAQGVGNEFVEKNEFAVMRVPSASVKGDFNYLLNPHHSDFKHIKITHTYPFQFDPRMEK